MSNYYRVGLVTGGSRGIGRATAVAMAKAGYAVITCGRDSASLAKVSEELEETGVPIATVVADLSEVGEAEKLIHFAIDRFGRIDLLVNNAGAAPRASIDEITAADFDRAVAVNIGATFHTTRSAWPAMRRQGGGTVINISSMASIDPFPGFQVYGACKAWVNLFTKAIADEGRPLGIRAFALALGAVETQMLRSAFPKFPAEQTLDPAQVAETILALSSSSLLHASGSTIHYRK